MSHPDDDTPLPRPSPKDVTEVLPAYESQKHEVTEVVRVRKGSRVPSPRDPTPPLPEDPRSRPSKPPKTDPGARRVSGLVDASDTPWPGLEASVVRSSRPPARELPPVQTDDLLPKELDPLGDGPFAVPLDGPLELPPRQAKERSREPRPRRTVSGVTNGPIVPPEVGARPFLASGILDPNWRPPDPPALARSTTPARPGDAGASVSTERLTDPRAAALAQDPGASGPPGRSPEPGPSARPGDAGPSARPGDAGPSARPGDASPSARPGDASPSARPGDASPSARPPAPGASALPARSPEPGSAKTLARRADGTAARARSTRSGRRAPPSRGTPPQPPRRYPKMRALLRNPDQVPGVEPEVTNRAAPVPGSFFPAPRPVRPRESSAELDTMLAAMADGLVLGASPSGGTEVRVTLRDEFFDGTELVISHGEGRIRAELVPPDRDTYLQLKGELDSLRERLHQRGLRVEDLRVREP